MTRNRDFNVVFGFVAGALAVGGAGLSFPLLAMLLELGAIGVLAFFALTRRAWRFDLLTQLSLILLVLVALLPLFQLIPLPPQLWHRLPGREVAVSIDSLVGWSPWRPFTLDAEASLRSWLRLLPAAAAFLGCLFLTPVERVRLTWLVLGFALAGAVLGVLQLATGGLLTPYPSAHSGYPIGLFVNRNHNAAFIIAAIPILGALAAGAITGRQRAVPIIAVAASALLILVMAVLGTTSRMALALLPLSIAAFVLFLLRRRVSARTGAVSVAAVVVLVVLLFATGGFAKTLARFSSLDDPRFGFWDDISWALGHYGLAGTGVGTFAPVYQSAESLEAISPAIVPHAHNDYLEILLEGGLVGAGLIVLFVALFGAVLVRLVRTRGGEQQLYRAAAAVGIVVLLFASAVDYPLRMPAISVAFAVLFAAILPAKTSAGAEAKASHRKDGAGTGSGLRRAVPVACVALLVPIAVLVIQAGISARALIVGQYAAAARFAPWSTAAHERLATNALLARQDAEARSEAGRALRLSPISVPAIRTSGLLATAEGRGDRGDQMVQIAATLSWRDPLTQLWAINAAIASNEPAKAMQRIEALFRQDLFVDAIAGRLLQIANPEMLRLIADRLAKNPPWRENFLRSAAKTASSDVRSFATVTRLLNQSPAPVTPREAQPLLESLVASDRVAEAQNLWLLVHARDLLTNGDFEELARPTYRKAPAGWVVSNDNKDRVKVAEPSFGPGRALHIATSRGSTIVSQSLMLRPGQYRLAYKATADRGGRGTFGWQLRCHGSKDSQVGNVAVSAREGWQQLVFTFAVPDSGCTRQKLSLTRAGDGPEQLWLDGLRIEPVK